MAIGSISSLGVGSGLELQNILEQLREVDERVNIVRQNELVELDQKLNEFTIANNKLLTMQSAALDLSLASTYLTRTVSSSEENVFTAAVSDATPPQTTQISVDRIAAKSTFISNGLASQDGLVHVPTSQQSTNGVASQISTIARSAGSLVIGFGAADTITVEVTALTKLDDGADPNNSLVHLINNVPENNGKVVASSFVVDGQHHLRIEAAHGSGEASRVAVTTNNTDLVLAPPPKAFAYQVGTETVNLTVSADTTMNQLIDLINSDSANLGVTASIIDSGEAMNPFKLVLQANNTGRDHEITIVSQLPDLALTMQGQSGDNLNSRITIDGISYQRQSNSVNDVLDGITLNLQSVGASSVSVASNNETLTTLITDFVTAYNEAVQNIQGQIAYDKEAAEFGILAGTTLRDIPFALERLMSSVVQVNTDSKITTMFDLGMEFNRDGTIAIDSTVLADKVANQTDDVRSFFLGNDDTGITGLADKVNEHLHGIVSGTGQIGAEKSAANVRIDDLELRIKLESARLDKRYELLTKQFIALDTFMHQMTSVSNYLTGQFESFNTMMRDSR